VNAKCDEPFYRRFGRSAANEHNIVNVSDNAKGLFRPVPGSTLLVLLCGRRSPTQHTKRDKEKSDGEVAKVEHAAPHTLARKSSPQPVWISGGVCQLRTSAGVLGMER
jgi:hypothetical protein